MKLKLLIILITLAILASSAFGRLSEEKLRYKFLVLCAGDIKYYDQFEFVKKKLSKEGKPAVWLAIQYMGRKSPRKARAIKWVAEGVGEDAVEPLTYVLTRPDEDNAAYAAYLLGEIGSRKAAVPLMLAAKSESNKLRSAAVGALGSCGDTSAVPILIEALSDTLPGVRRRAALSLGKLKDKRAIQHLIPLMGDTCVFVRYTTSYALAQIGGEKTTKILLEKLQSDTLDNIERYHIIETLGLLNSDESLPTLLELLEDPLYLNRGFACQALGHFRGHYEVANALKRSLHDASGFVQMMAHDALKSIRND